MLSDHETRPFPKAALVLIHIQENPNLKGKSDESDAILDSLDAAEARAASQRRSAPPLW
jgi:hypothetical protein